MIFVSVCYLLHVELANGKLFKAGFKIPDGWAKVALSVRVPMSVLDFKGGMGNASYMQELG